MRRAKASLKRHPQEKLPMLYGKVVFYDDVKGRGLIDDGETPENYLVDYKDITGDGFKSLSVGDRVKFKCEKSGEKLKAGEVEVVRPATDLSSVEQLLDVRWCRVPRRVKEDLVKILPEKQQTLVSEVTAELDPSIEQTIKRVGLARREFRVLDGLAAKNLSETYVRLIKGSEGGVFGSFVRPGL